MQHRTITVPVIEKPITSNSMPDRSGDIAVALAAVIRALFVGTICYGCIILCFVNARTAVQSDHRQAETLRAWQRVVGVAGAAATVAVANSVPSIGTTAVSDLGDAFAVSGAQPLSATRWASLAGEWLANAKPLDDVAAAIAMSEMTGPNEVLAMAQRGILGLLLWDVMSDDQHARTAADLAGAIPALANADDVTKMASAIVQKKSRGVRDEIERQLRDHGLSQTNLMRVGLSATAGAATPH